MTQIDPSIGQPYPQRNTNIDLNPFWISGFVDGEGCFSVTFSVRENRKPPIEVRPSFSVSQTGKRQCSVLQAIQRSFGCGGIRYSAHDGTYKYEVRSLDDLLSKIIPHFQRYSLMTPKSEDFQRLVKICQLMKRNHHKNSEGLRTIIYLAFEMNPNGKRRYSCDELLKLIGS